MVILWKFSEMSMCVAAPVEESLKKTYLVQVPPVCVFRWGSLLLMFVFFEASYVRRSDVFSCKTLSLGKPSGQVHWYHWWPFAMPWPGHCCQWFDRTGCLRSRLPRERCEACLSASQTQTMTNLWHCHRIPKGRKRHENIILTWCSLPFPATSVLFLARFTVSLNFWENSTTTITTTITTTTTITITTTTTIIIIITTTLFESPPFVLSPPRGSSHWYNW